MKKFCKRCDAETRRNTQNRCAPCMARVSAEYRAANPDKWSATVAKFRAANPDKARAAGAKRYAKDRATDRGKVLARAAKQRAALKAARCKCCTDKEVAAQYWLSEGCDIDHKVPLALGGKHCVHNLQLLTIPQHVEKTRTDMAAIRRARRSEQEASILHTVIP